MKFEDFIQEGKKITLKRQYTENYPAITAGQHAKIRNKVLEAIGDGKITQEEFDTILKELSNNSKRWAKTNSKYFNVSEDGISLSVFGKRVLSSINISEEKLEEGRKFVAAARKAKDEGKEEFEFEGKTFPVTIKESALYEATVEMDAMDPDNKDFLKFLKKHRVKIINKEMDGPGGGNPVITMQGKRKDLESVLADGEYGWDDPDLAEYIEESVVNENYEVIYSDGISALKKFRSEAQALDFMKQTIASNKKLRDIAVYKPGMYSTTQTELVVAFWGNGSYLDNVSKKDPKLAAKKLEESEYVEEGRKFVAAAKKAKDAGDEEFEFNGKKFPVTIKEGNAFGAARAKAIADGKDEFTVDGETYKVKSVDKEDKENAEEFKGESFIIESFSKFVESLNESEMLTEAFKSMKLAQLLTPKKKTNWDKGLAQEFYNYTKVKMDKIEDHDLLEIDPQTAYKQKGGTKVKFFLIDNEKQSPYTEDRYDGKISAGLIAVLDGNNDFMGSVYKRFSSDKGRVLTKTNKADSLGVDKRRKGYGATGLSSAKKIADFADRAIVIDIDILRQRYSAEQQRTERAAAQKGAIAFKSDKEFKAENVARYKEILANKAAALPLDKMVNDAIDKIAAQIKEGLAKGEKTNYGEIKIGENKRGSAVKMRDAANHMQNILDNYDRYVNYVAQAEKEKAEWGKENSYYEAESKTYAKEVKDKINQIDTFDYAW